MKRRRLSEQDVAVLRRPPVKRAVRHKTAQGQRQALRPRSPSETAECRTFIGWTKLVTFDDAPLFDRVVKIPNERGKRGVATAILAAIGMRAGFPDYAILAAGGNYHGLFIEAKRVTDGVIDSEQEAWRDRLTAWGYGAAICEGAVEMIRAVKRYMMAAGLTHSGRFVDRTRIGA